MTILNLLVCCYLKFFVILKRGMTLTNFVNVNIFFLSFAIGYTIDKAELTTSTIILGYDLLALALIDHNQYIESYLNANRLLPNNSVISYEHNLLSFIHYTCNNLVEFPSILKQRDPITFP